MSDDFEVVEDALLVSSKRDPAFLALARLRKQRSLQDVRICDLQDEIARLREREAQWAEWRKAAVDEQEKRMAAEAHVAELEEALREIENGGWGAKAAHVNYDIAEFARRALAHKEETP